VITAQAARSFDRIVGRRVLLWDDYPANDYTDADDPHDLHLGPVRGRGPDLAAPLQGIVADPMAAWAADKIPLATVADLLRDPAHYNPERSWHNAIAEVGGPWGDALAALAANSRSSPLDPRDAVVFQPAADGFWGSFPTPAWPGPASALAEELARDLAAGPVLHANFDREFVAETAPFLERLEINAAAGTAALRLVTDERPSILARLQSAQGVELVTGNASPPDPVETALDRATLAHDEALMLADVHNVHGHRLSTSPPGRLDVGHNHMDAFVERALDTDGAWQGEAGVAASRLTVTVNGRAVGRQFSVTLPLGTPATIIATDGVGHQTEVVLSSGA
jgi:hypothetical protein